MKYIAVVFLLFEIYAEFEIMIDLTDSEEIAVSTYNRFGSVLFLSNFFLCFHL